MTKQYMQGPQTLLQRIEGPLVDYLDLYIVGLKGQGYAPRTVVGKIHLVTRFSQWLLSNGVSLSEIRNSHARTYLEQRKQRPRKGDRFTLTSILRILQEQGAVALEPIICTPADKLIDEFSRYLQQERGLAASTIRGYADCMRKFLCDQFSDEIEFSKLRAASIVSFVRRHAAQSKRAKIITNALRAFLRYMQYRGYITLNLAAAVPSVPNWQKATIPKSLPLDQVERVLASFDPETAEGRRDYAILLLLARLGLRSGEVAFLMLDDIDWVSGCIRVRGKGGQTSELPLPPDVGEALAEYLRNDRPLTINRYVFLRHIAPITNFTSQRSVRDVVNRALKRAGVDSPRRGAHQFRHALATKMLQRGASLAEIGELLRHQSADSTEIYAKVDLLSLQAVAMPWPGGLL